MAAPAVGPVQTQPKPMQGADILHRVHDVASGGLPAGAGTGDYVVDGVQAYDGWFLKCERLIMKSGAELHFSRQAQQARTAFYVIAKEFIVEDQQKPGKITWDRVSLPPSTGGAGQAPTGPHAVYDDTSGGPGTPGAQGAIGLQGNNAPSLTLMLEKVQSSGAYIDLTGQAGGEGGQGQTGGDGGNGAKGHPATATLFGCANGAGNGGAGGAGGVGGLGGVGGRGGAGGQFTLLAVSPDTQTLGQKFRVDVAGGMPGNPGQPGKGGLGGRGGPRGAPALPFCQDDGRDGAPGAGGSAGGAGSVGTMGTSGDFYVGNLTQQVFDSIF